MHACVLGTPGSEVGGFAAATLVGLSDFRPCHPELAVPQARVRAARPRRSIATSVRDDRRGWPAGHDLVARTLFGSAARVGLWRLERAMDDALVGGKLTVELSARSACASMKGRVAKGYRRLRPLIEERRAVGWAPPGVGAEAHPVRHARPGTRARGRAATGFAAAPVTRRNVSIVSYRFPRSSARVMVGVGTRGSPTSTAIAGATTRPPRMDCASCASPGCTSHGSATTASR